VQVLETVERLELNLTEYLKDLLGYRGSMKPLANQIGDLSDRMKIIVDHVNTLTSGLLISHSIAINKLTQFQGNERNALNEKIAELQKQTERKLSAIEVRGI
jgi:hypothetical protein